MVFRPFSYKSHHFYLRFFRVRDVPAMFSGATRDICPVKWFLLKTKIPSVLLFIPISFSYGNGTMMAGIYFFKARVAIRNVSDFPPVWSFRH
jgi:hypothetical protein